MTKRRERSGASSNSLPRNTQETNFDLETVRYTNALRVSLDQLFGRIKGKDTAANRAREDLGDSLWSCINRLCDMAQSAQDTVAKQWAGELLARIYVNLQKHHQKLRHANSSYCKCESKLRKSLRSDVMFPRGKIAKFVQKELSAALRYQPKLRGLRAIQPTIWQQLTKELKIPRKYWSVMDLPEFGEKSKDEWWKFIWELAKHPRLLRRLRESGKGRHRAKTGRLYLKDFHKQFRKVFDKLVALREAGIF